jgi:hypothetical protein
MAATDDQEERQRLSFICHSARTGRTVGQTVVDGNDTSDPVSSNESRPALMNGILRDQQLMIENARQQVPSKSSQPVVRKGKQEDEEEDESTAAAAKSITANSIVVLLQTLSGTHLVPDRGGIIAGHAAAPFRESFFAAALLRWPCVRTKALCGR